MLRSVWYKQKYYEEALSFIKRWWGVRKHLTLHDCWPIGYNFRAEQGHFFQGNTAKCCLGQVHGLLEGDRVPPEVRDPVSHKNSYLVLIYFYITAYFTVVAHNDELNQTELKLVW